MKAINPYIRKPGFVFFAALTLLILFGYFMDAVCRIFFNGRYCDVTYFSAGSGLLKIFVITVLLGPFIETLIFQYLLIKKTPEKIKRNIPEPLLVLISAVLFGVSHSYNILTIIGGVFAGLILATAFILFDKQGKNALLYVTLLHASFNLFVFLVEDVR